MAETSDRGRALLVADEGGAYYEIRADRLAEFKLTDDAIEKLLVSSEKARALVALNKNQEAKKVVNDLVKRGADNVIISQLKKQLK